MERCESPSTCDIVDVNWQLFLCLFLQKVDLNQKKRDFMHLLFNEGNAGRILQFAEVMAEMKKVPLIFEFYCKCVYIVHVNLKIQRL